MFSGISPFSVEFLSTPSVHNSLLSTEEKHALLHNTSPTSSTTSTEDHNSSRDSSFNAGMPSPSSSGGEEIVSPPLKKNSGRHVVGSNGVVYKKPSQSYISIISTAVLTKPEKKILLHEIYEFFEQKFPYFKYVESQAWKNSIRHNLSLNECFIKNGRSDNGKGNFWSVHPACIEDFSKGDFRRRQARQRAKRGSFHQTNTGTLVHHSNNNYYPHQMAAAAEPHLYGNSTTTTSGGYTPMKSVPTNMGRSSRQYHPYQQRQQQASSSPSSCLLQQYNHHHHQYSSLLESSMPSTLSLPNTTSSYTPPAYSSALHHQNSYPMTTAAAITPSCLYASSQATQDKLPPPNINAAHLAQLGLSGSVSNARDYFGVHGVRGFMKGYL